MICPHCGTSDRGPYSTLEHRSECERCGELVCQPTGSGRRRRWCSDGCRRRGWEERQAAERGAIAVRKVPVQPTLSECVERVADSPAAVRHLLRALRDKAEQGEMRRGAWDATLRALYELVGSVDPYGDHSPDQR